MEGDLEHFFGHEKQAYPHSLSEHGSLRPAKRKSSIIGCILLEDFTSPNEGPNVSANIFDSAAITNIHFYHFLTIHR